MTTRRSFLFGLIAALIVPAVEAKGRSASRGMRGARRHRAARGSGGGGGGGRSPGGCGGRGGPGYRKSNGKCASWKD